MRELTIQAAIPGCTTKEFYDIACSDSKAIRRFHIEVKKDETVTVSEWEQKARVVTFTMDMAIPTSLKRFVGADPIRIKEKQSYEWDGDTLKIVSIPIPQISLAKSLNTRAELLISNSSEGCTIDVLVTVVADVPWPMQGTIESIMADEAKRTVGKYVDYITKYVEDELNNQLLQQQQQEEPQPMEIAAIVAVEEQQQQQLSVATLAGQPSATGAMTAIGPTAIASPAASVAAEAVAAAAVAVEPTFGDARALVSRGQGSVTTAAAAAAAADVEVFYDASEGSSAALEALVRELQQAQAARQEANRLLLSIKESVQQLERSVLKEVAFQEGVRYGQRLGSGSLMLSVAAAAAAASAATAFIMMRQSSK